MSQPIQIYTDGACSGNPGLGAWSYLVEYDTCINARAAKHNGPTTNNRMELTAVTSALESIKPYVRANSSVEVFSDSKYVIEGINLYLAKWLQNNWITSTKKPVANQDLWKTLIAVKATFSTIKFTWVKGHASCHYNNICDAMAQKLVG
jgi:ribonuclease HI